jgi:hypothetical protein
MQLIISFKMIMVTLMVIRLAKETLIKMPVLNAKKIEPNKRLVLF